MRNTVEKNLRRFPGPDVSRNRPGRKERMKRGIGFIIEVIFFATSSAMTFSPSSVVVTRTYTYSVVAFIDNDNDQRSDVLDFFLLTFRPQLPEYHNNITGTRRILKRFITALRYRACCAVKTYSKIFFFCGYY